MDQSTQIENIQGLFSLGIKWDFVQSCSGDSGQGVTLLVGFKVLDREFRSIGGYDMVQW